MAYRVLSEVEIATFIEERATFERWQAYAAFALKVYGPAAARVIVAGDLVYNDETDVLRITDFEVFTADGEELPSDWRSDWWRTPLHKEHAEIAKLATNDRDDEARYYALDYAHGRLPVPPQRDDFLVQTPPARRFPAVYVEEG